MRNITQTTQEKQMEGMMKRPIPKKKVGIIHLEMVRESRLLYGMRRFSQPDEAVEMVRPLFAMADRKLMFVMSLNTKLEPMAVEIAAVGGLDVCAVDVRSLFKHALLNNAAYIICFHNHPSGYAEPSGPDQQLTERIKKSGELLGIPLIDHIITGEEGYYSFREHGRPVSVLPDDAA